MDLLHNKKEIVMEQYIPKSALLAEIERLVNNYDKALDYEAALEDVRNFIDSMQEEPVSEDLLVAANKAWQESEDRESYAETFEDGFKAGAKWQKEKEYTCYEEAFEDGAKWKKEQMMAKAIDGVITFDYYGDDDKTYGCIAHDSFCLEDFGLKDMDKVKMILIKED